MKSLKFPNVKKRHDTLRKIAKNLGREKIGSLELTCIILDNAETDLDMLARFL